MNRTLIALLLFLGANVHLHAGTKEGLAAVERRDYKTAYVEFLEGAKNGGC